jgi:acyl carrier protein
VTLPVPSRGREAPDPSLGCKLDFDRLSRFLDEDLGIDVAGIEPDTPLFSSGIIDSFSLVTLLTFLESEGGIRISPADVNLDNMDSLARMLAYVERARG